MLVPFMEPKKRPSQSSLTKYICSRRFLIKLKQRDLWVVSGNLDEVLCTGYKMGEVRIGWMILSAAELVLCYHLAHDAFGSTMQEQNFLGFRSR